MTSKYWRCGDCNKVFILPNTVRRALDKSTSLVVHCRFCDSDLVYGITKKQYDYNLSKMSKLHDD